MKLSSIVTLLGVRVLFDGFEVMVLSAVMGLSVGVLLDAEGLGNKVLLEVSRSGVKVLLDVGDSPAVKEPKVVAVLVIGVVLFVGSAGVS